jgi:phosphohistidine phosphatase SixA
MTVFLVRHAQAGSRSDSEVVDDILRPLNDEGRLQAAAIVSVLAAMGVRSVYCSPYRRCVQTAVPLAAHLGVSVIQTSDLGEGVAVGAVRMVRELANESAALFSHGDIIPSVLETLARTDGLDLGSTPKCQKGSIWMLETNGSSDVFVRATYVPPSRFTML